jgi:transposase
MRTADGARRGSSPRPWATQTTANGRVVGDTGYRSKRIWQYLQQRGIRITIPRKTNERRTGPCNRALYRERNRIERLSNRLKQYRRIATRYEKRAANYVAMLTLVAIRLWL